MLWKAVGFGEIVGFSEIVGIRFLLCVVGFLFGVRFLLTSEKPEIFYPLVGDFTAWVVSHLYAVTFSIKIQLFVLQSSGKDCLTILAPIVTVVPFRRGTFVVVVVIIFCKSKIIVVR